MLKTTIVVLLTLVAHPICAAELTLDQQLILACYQLQVDKVVTCLRKGANVNGRFGDRAYKLPEFHDRWTGAYPSLGSGAWTPLLALANAPKEPDPPAELGEIWKDRDQSEMLRSKIPEEQIENRRKDTMIILYILLSHKCNLDDNDGYGATALYESVFQENIQMAKILLHYGANPNTKTRTYIDGPGNTTPLHYACYSSPELIQLLLVHGADPNAKDDNGRTPVDWLKRNGSVYHIVKTPKGWRVRPRPEVKGLFAKPPEIKDN
jgi:hypothetical protein